MAVLGAVVPVVPDVPLVLLALGLDTAATIAAATAAAAIGAAADTPPTAAPVAAAPGPGCWAKPLPAIAKAAKAPDTIFVIGRSIELAPVPI